MVQRLEQIQSQSQVLAPQLRQSLKILQVSAMELRNVVLEELQLNPTLEEAPLEEISLDSSDVRSEVDDRIKNADESNDVPSIDNGNQALAVKKHDFLMNSLTSNVSLQDFLYEQIGCLDLRPEIERLVKYLIGSLDEKGFMSVPVEDISRQTREKKELVEEALNVLRQLEPTGIGSSDVRNCLLQQLRAQNKAQSVAFKIIDEYYDLLLRNRVLDIAHYLGVTKEVIQKAISIIATLDPAPGRRFEQHHVQGVVPDVSVYKSLSGEWIVELNNQYIPRLFIGETYKNLLNKTYLKDSDKQYLRMKMRSGRFLIQSIAHRQKTIEKITYAILDLQRNFFENGPGDLKPLTLQALANTIHVHETTVSRAIANKFMDTPFGIFEFKYFFTKGLNSDLGGAIANTIIKQQIQLIIEQEDKSKPLSDQRIVAKLAQNNVQIARRTVAKYRELLGIPPTNLRRKFD